MDDYINRKDVLRLIKKSKDIIDWQQSEYRDALKHYIEILYRTISYKKFFPSADVRPVVLCKNCALWNRWDRCEPSSLQDFSCSCANWTIDGEAVYTKPDDFCSYGIEVDE